LLPTAQEIRASSIINRAEAAPVTAVRTSLGQAASPRPAHPTHMPPIPPIPVAYPVGARPASNPNHPAIALKTRLAVGVTSFIVFLMAAFGVKSIFFSTEAENESSDTTGDSQTPSEPEKADIAVNPTAAPKPVVTPEPTASPELTTSEPAAPGPTVAPGPEPSTSGTIPVPGPVKKTAKTKRPSSTKVDDLPPPPERIHPG
jgi:hypothetical protein